MTLPNIGLPPISTDLIIAGVMGLILLYGLLLGHNKLKTFALSSFVGLVMVLTFSDGLFALLQKTNLTFDGKVTLPAVKIALFAIPVLALEFGKKEGKRGSSSFALTLVLCVLTAALLVSTVFSFLEPAAVSGLTERSQLANWIYSFRLVWLGGVPVVVITESLMGRSKAH